MELVWEYIVRGVLAVLFTADGAFNLLPIAMVFGGLMV